MRCVWPPLWCRGYLLFCGQVKIYKQQENSTRTNLEDLWDHLKETWHGKVLLKVGAQLVSFPKAEYLLGRLLWFAFIFFFIVILGLCYFSWPVFAVHSARIPRLEPVYTPHLHSILIPSHLGKACLPPSWDLRTMFKVRKRAGQTHRLVERLDLCSLFIAFK